MALGDSISPSKAAGCVRMACVFSGFQISLHYVAKNARDA